MKKIILIIMLLPTLATSQLLDLPVSKSIIVKSFDEFPVTVPSNKLWQFVGATQGEYIKIKGDQNNPGTWKIGYYIENEYFVEISDHHNIVGNVVLGEGTSILYESNGENYRNVLFFVEYDLSSQNMSYNNIESLNPILFPNPTNSMLALNSDKQYDIEVYDIAGNKVMALSGNTINMAHLSTATYIVNAIDKETNEKLSYKVIKK
tara:strand:+ start:664 stop:1281 length:618 start_codon:yes stop_codon:yes gene_type:complete